MISNGLPAAPFPPPPDPVSPFGLVIKLRLCDYGLKKHGRGIELTCEEEGEKFALCACSERYSTNGHVM